MAATMAAEEKKPLPNLHVTLLPPGDDEASLEVNHQLMSTADTFNDVLALYMPDSWAQSCSILASLEMADGQRAYISDLSAPVVTALAVLPEPCSRVIFTFTCTPIADQTRQTRSRRRPLKHVGGLLKRLVLLGIKTVVALELIGFGLSRLRLVRYLGRRERWGPPTGELESTDDSEEAVGTSSDVAELLLDYLEGDANAKDFEGVSAEEVIRGIKKISPADLKELNLDPSGVQQALEQLQLLAERLESQAKPAEGSSTQQANPKP